MQLTLTNDDGTVLACYTILETFDDDTEEEIADLYIEDIKRMHGRHGSCPFGEIARDIIILHGQEKK